MHTSQQQSHEGSINFADMKHIIYTNQTGEFLVVLSQANQYITIIYTKDGNLIIVKPMKTKPTGKICLEYQKLMQHLKDRGILIRKHILDNETLEWVFANNQKQLQWIQKSSPIHSQIECNQKSYMKLGSFHFHPCWYWQVFPHVPVGSLVTPGRAHIKHATTNKHLIRSLGICIQAWPTQLQQNATGTLGVCCPPAQLDVYKSLQRLLHWNTGTLWDHHQCHEVLQTGLKASQTDELFATFDKEIQDLTI